MATRVRKHQPHERLKLLRKIIGLTQEQLAPRIGKSYPYLLSIECGQREMSGAVADLLARATGINPDWLLGDGSTTSPKDCLGRAYTKDLWDGQYAAPAPILGKLPFTSRHLISMLTFHVVRVLRAAVRKGRFGVAQYLVTTALDKCLADEKDEGLGLRDTFDHELDPGYSHLTPDDPLFAGYYAALKTLSPESLHHLEDVMEEGPDETDAQIVTDLRSAETYLTHLFTSYGIKLPDYNPPAQMQGGAYTPQQRSEVQAKRKAANAERLKRRGQDNRLREYASALKAEKAEARARLKQSPTPPLASTESAVESPNTSEPPPASLAPGSDEKAFSGPRARAARKSRPRS